VFYRKTGVRLLGKLRTANNKLIEVVGSRCFFWFIIALFVVQAAIIALITKFGLPPDENFHFNFIKLYAERSYDPFLAGQEGYHWLGDVTRRGSVLFHYVMSWPYRLLDGLQDTYIYLRFINIGFAVGTLLLVKKLAAKLELSDFTANLSLFMLVNTLMFTFLSAAISYDNPVIMLSMLSLVLLVSLLRRFRTFTFLSLVLVMIIAAVVKFTFLPLALFVTLAIIFRYGRQLGEKGGTIVRDIKSNLLAPRWLALLLLLLLGLAFAVERYGVNIVDYGEIRVDCTAVHSVEDCRQYPIYRRSQRIEAMDRNPSLSPPVFAVKWAETAKERVYGVFAHEIMPAPSPVTYGTWLIIAVMVFAFARKYSWKGRPLDYVLVISLAYVALVAIKNYSGYSDHGIFGLALQGRYIFPVFPVFYLIGTHYVGRLLRNRNVAMLGYTILVLAVFIIAGLPGFLWLAGPEWYASNVPAFLVQ
jgi:hypothetical protein